MSTAKRLVLSLTGRKESQGTAGTGASSTRLVSNSPGHELDEIAIVSSCGAESTTGRVSYGSLSLGQANGPRFPGEIFSFYSLFCEIYKYPLDIVYPFSNKTSIKFILEFRNWAGDCLKINL
jgi:hypothetical protein